ncbi:uroporphyrinogen decarboxylase family protein [Sunxiuqinia sp. sy24]|uniref:uroporphyrinogen decarboxylase family protein n=1 Tax=Sunxiuqinia sp. sy24 TaxID=3461495 RepID=UPI00404532CA
MKSRDCLRSSLNHKQPDKIPIDFGSNAVTGIHVRIVEQLREYYGLEKRLVKVIEPYQMLGEIDDDLLDVLGVDVIGLWGKNNMFGIPQEKWKPFKTFWGQEILVPGNFNATIDSKGDLLIHPEGDRSVPAGAKMPKASFFFDAIVRQEPIDDSKLNPEDNLEEFTRFSEEDLNYWKEQALKAATSGKGVIANFGGTGLGDIALVTAMNLKNPKGIRDITEWYMSTLMRPDYLHQVFDKQTDIAVENLKRAYEVVGENIDAVFICGTDFGTQDSTFCSVEAYEELYAPYYRKVNDWIHQNTGWKTFKHSCGAVESFMKPFIDSGFDIINPVQINASGMVPEHLKKEYGDHLVFWGGGVDTQKMLPFGKPEEVKEQVLRMCEIFSKDGGFVFNTVHNIQANVPVENVIAMLDAVHEFNN